jgi:hypothetical protein
MDAVFNAIFTGIFDGPNLTRRLYLRQPGKPLLIWKTGYEARGESVR